VEAQQEALDTRVAEDKQVSCICALEAIYQELS